MKPHSKIWTRPAASLKAQPDKILAVKKAIRKRAAPVKCPVCGLVECECPIIALREDCDTCNRSWVCCQSLVHPTDGSKCQLWQEILTTATATTEDSANV